MLNYTHVLFEKILMEEGFEETNKQEKMENIIKSLQHFSSEAQLSPQLTE